MRRLLILGGTAEARALAAALAADPGLEVTSSLAGRTAEPRRPAGRTRTGGFGGAAGLDAWLRAERIDVLVDATHPFAQEISRSAAEAAASRGIPLLALRRPGWTAGPGDRWSWAATVAEAATRLPALGTRPLLTIGRQELAAFAAVDLPVVARTVESPAPPLPPRCRLLLSRGPFTLDGERALLREHRIDVLVTKDSGGPATAPKLTAARESALPVLIVRRPAPPPGVPAVATPAAAIAWLRAHG
ncbi:precorrin-6A/cobalt-precorrin-6A reductase [Streptomyces sp. DvalAA-14]|uniref:cobalt-precorrin-6A reductase n=1 Tax=unclassified Streptomyces TaxID=2593676 RepID=UPI00081B80BF|nr:MULTISPECIES: cobalt-precorrin-6A reductase [unclassified Streptomyces]MYS20945.1 cobalt-precorrin-6A reductase [Streptomyces sp. SID4948]SCD80564.1 precorrin-6A/cobalt-precorrin-6A reductase [Streptomyces sp. DvalAA-14]